MNSTAKTSNNKLKIQVLIVLAISVALLSSCAVGQKIDYQVDLVPVEITTQTPVDVVVIDKRPYVLNGDKTESYVGLLRAGFGNPWDVNTKSGRPLAYELGMLTVKSLNDRGIRAKLNEYDTASNDNAYLLNIVLYKWRSETYTNTAIFFDIEASVYNGDNNEVGRKRYTGEKDLGGSFLDPGTHAKEQVPIGAQEIFSILLNFPEIANAFK